MVTFLQTVSLQGEADPGWTLALTKPVESEIWSDRFALGSFLVLSITPISFYFSSPFFIFLYMQGKDSQSFLPVRNHFLLITSATINIHHISWLIFVCMWMHLCQPHLGNYSNTQFLDALFLFSWAHECVCVSDLCDPCRSEDSIRFTYRRLWATRPGSQEANPSLLEEQQVL